MADIEMNTELVCIMASLGYYDGTDYYKGVDCLASLKDLIRFLRREDDTCNIRRQMGSAQLLQKDLIPILVHVTDDEEVLDITIRLLVNLTSPADICFNKHDTEAEQVGGKETLTEAYQTNYLQVVQYLQSYKEAFTKEDAMAAIATQIGKVLQTEWEERSEDQLILFERLLLLIRNILHVPSSPQEEKRTEDDVSIHDQVLWNMHVNGIDDLIIYITSSYDESRWVMHGAEIIQSMLREQNAEVLAKSSKERSEDEKTADTKELVVQKEKEEAIKKAANEKVACTRHSRFGGSFWVMNLRGVGKKNVLVHHKHVKDPEDISFDHKKYRAKKPKREKEAVEMVTQRKSTLSIRLLLKEFCMKFLEHSYNSFMRIVKDNVAAKRSQENDDSYYLWILRFFMAFNRSLSFKVDYISETLNMNSFHYILKQLDTYHERVLMCKKGGWQPWQRRLHYALSAYKESLTYLSCMDQANDNVLTDASSMMKNNVFYHEEYRNVFIRLFRHFDKTKQTRKFLTDLVDTFHIFLRLLEKFCGSKGSLIVKAKKKVVKRRKKKKQSSTSARQQFTAEQLDDLWENELAPGLSAILQGNEEIPDDLDRPFDVSSDVPVDEQSMVALVKIQDFLRNGQCGHAVGLLKAARECWPSENQFGAADIPPEEEFGVIRNILFQELERSSHMMNEQLNEEEGDEEEENGVIEEELEETRTQNVEREFHLKSFLMSLATSSILSPYNYLFEYFDTNSSFTNHAIIKMMHRVAVDLKFPEMLFQLSTFITFKKILQMKTSENKEMIKFAQFIIRKFVEAAEKNPRIYVELMFWKGTGDCYEITNREDEQRQKEKHREKWSFEEEEELKSLYDQFRHDDDVVGEILKNISKTDRTRRQITNKLVRLQLVENSKQLPRPKQARPPKWSEEQTAELHRIYDEMKETIDPLANIMNALSFPKSKQAITKHLLDTGKVSDRKQLRKKRQKKNREFKEKVKRHRILLSGDEHTSGSSGGETDDEQEIDGDARDREDNESTDEEENVVNESESDDDMIDVSENKSGGVDDTFEDSSLDDLIKDIKYEGFGEQLSWLQSRLTRAAQSREEDPQDEWCAIPLLTMTEEDENAIGNKVFKTLLKKFKLKPPADEQEAFWRIPATLSPSVLRRYVEEIQQAEKHTKSSTLTDNIGGMHSNNSVTTDNDINEHLTNVSNVNEQQLNASPVVNRKRVKRPHESESDTESEEHSNRKKKTKRKIQIEDSEESDIEETSKTHESPEAVEPTTLDIDDSVPLTKLLHIGHTENAENSAVSMETDENTQNVDDDISLSNLASSATD